MSTEQLAIVASAIVAVLTVWITAAFQAKINRQTLESQRMLALQERVRATYEDMLHMIGWVMELVDARKPIIEYAGSPKPEEPDMERVRMVQARIGVHGSREVKGIIEKWARRRNEFFAEAGLLDSMQEAEQRGVDVDKKYGNPISEQWKKVQGIRQELHGIVRDLEEAVNAEMRS